MTMPGLPVGGAASPCTEAQCHIETDNNMLQKSPSLEVRKITANP